MNSAAADVVCNILGYAHGSVGSSKCSFYGGVDLCAAPGRSHFMSTCALGRFRMENGQPMFKIHESANNKSAHE